MKIPTRVIIADKYGPAMKIASQEEADAYFEACVDHRIELLLLDGKIIDRNEAEKLERDDIAFYSGYYDHETRRRVEKLFMCEHPYFGSIERNGPPTPEAAFAMGVEIGRKVKKTSR
jgi:hypothetical protein